MPELGASKTKAVLAFGSNLGKRRKTIKSAVRSLKAHPEIFSAKLSPFVESPAVTENGVDPSKPKYVNAVALVSTSLKPKQLLTLVRQIETDHGRVRIERWGSRTLDIDIITYGGEIKATKELTIPHPRAYQRKFVLLPWSLLEPEAVLPGHGSVAKLAAEASDEAWVLE